MTAVVLANAPARRRRPWLLIIAGTLAALQVLGALAAPVVAPHDPVAQSVLARLRGPGPGFLLGTDQFGRDILSRILYGYRSSFLVSGISVALALAIGGTLGIFAAWRGGWIDRIIMRVMDVLFAFPVILLAIGIIAVLGPGAGTTAIAIGTVYVPIFARLLRGPALVIVGSEYVMGARAVGAGDARILFRHIVPNLTGVILVQASLSLSAAILVEASLSFLGVGTQPPEPSLGRMLAEGRTYLLLSPWNSIFAGLAILLASFAFNLFGDALRDRLDPKLRGNDRP